jgi:CubicO group peptidase (beta-lactamase class C family)
MRLQRREFLKQLGLGAAGLGLVTPFPATAWAETRAAAAGLPRSTPEAQGVESAAILAFLEAIEASKHEFHSFMMLRRGHVVAEGWWSPYRADLKHTLYSLSKSFTSTAVGLAVSEGKLNVDDAVAKFFPEDLPAPGSEHLAALRVKHLLTMSVGQAEDPTATIVRQENWVRAFLALPIQNAPGTVFLYNSGATYLLSAIVQKVTGQKVIDYLTPRLLEPLGVKDAAWETCPRGINTGGWGLSVPTEALAKFGQLYLQQGVWNGRAILPAAWVQEATSSKIEQGSGGDLERLRRDSDWHQGYGYQFWRCRHGAFRGDGAFGQYAIVMPEQEAVVAITSESPDMQGELNLVWAYLLRSMHPKALPADKAAQAAVRQKLSMLALPLPKGVEPGPVQESVSDKWFKLESNEMNAQAVSFAFRGKSCVFTLADANASHTIVCGQGDWVPGETAMPGTPPRLIPTPVVGKSKVAACGRWLDAATYEMTWRFCETPHHDTVTCHFQDDKVRIEFMNTVSQINPGRKERRPVLNGVLSA